MFFYASSSSLEFQELAEMVRSIRTIEESLGSREKRVQECEKPCFEKLGKSIVAAHHIPDGHRLGWTHSMHNLKLLIVDLILLIELVLQIFPSGQRPRLATELIVT